MATETTGSCPRLRSDLVIETQGEGKTLRYLIIDPANGRYFQCGAPQYMLLALSTREFTPVEIITRYSEQTHIRLLSDQLDAVLHKVAEWGFLVYDGPVHTGNPLAPPVLPQRQRMQWRFSKRWRLFRVQLRG